MGKAIEKEGAYFGYVKLPPPPPPTHQIFDVGDNFVVTLTDQRTLKYSDLWKSDNYMSVKFEPPQTKKLSTACVVHQQNNLTFLHDHDVD